MKKMNEFINENFINDKCKIADMLLLTRNQFLDSYSYLTEDEYNNTYNLILDSLKFGSESIKEFNLIHK